MFQFLDKSITTREGKGVFAKQTSWGFQYTFGSHDDSANSARWGRVFAIGPEVPDYIVVGEYIYIEQLMWTEGFNLNGNKYWVTATEKVLATAIEPIHEH